MNRKFAIAIHGGAGTILKSLMTEEKEMQYKNALNHALKLGYDLLKKGGSSLDAVTLSVTELENFPLFNAGKGSVFTHDEKHEMDAAIMRGDNLDAGAISGVSNIKNPVVLARAVMEKSEHVLLSGPGAENFAKLNHITFEKDEYFFDQYRYDQLQEAKRENRIQLDHSDEKKFGTVGAVALDMEGNLAAATSTGGMTNKKFGRVGDTPLIGAGTYANNKTCAVSATGHGEYFIRSVVAYDISCLMEYKGLSLEDACRIVVHEKLIAIGGEGGLIAVDASGSIVMDFNSEGMYRGKAGSDDSPIVEIYK